MFIEPRSFARCTVSSFLSEDHKQLEVLFKVAAMAFDERRLQDGDRAFREFRKSLEQHLRMEEEVLFPKLEYLTHDCCGEAMIAGLREDHETIRSLLDQIADILSTGDNPSTAAEELRILLDEHARREEPTLYQVTDRLADSPLASAMVHGLMVL